MSFKIFVEGGGDGRNRGKGKSLPIDCKEAFRTFFEESGLTGGLPAVVACGSRDKAFDMFKTALAGTGEKRHPLLLVDSEGPVKSTDPWEHLRQRDEWKRPADAGDDDAHLMVQQMESWFLADRQALADHFGPKFAKRHLPGIPEDVESVPKKDVMRGLEDASRPSKRGKYSKARDSFEILSTLDPIKVQQGSSWAQRLIERLRHQPS